MAQTPEGRIKAKAKKILEYFGAYYITPATYGYGASGAPDVVACYRGRFIGIECKAGKNTTTAIQERNLLNIAAMGGIALVIRENNLKELVDALEGLQHESV